MRVVALLAFLLSVGPASGQIVVVNQGNFSTGDGSLTLIPEFSGGGAEAVQLFEGQLGSILQSAARYGDYLYVISNSANRLEIVALETTERVGQVAGGFSGPRYLGFVGGGSGLRAYVSNQVYGGTSYILPVDLTARTVGTPIEVDGLPEAIAVVPYLGTKAYVALGTFGPGAGGVDSLAVLDTEADRLLGYIDIGCFARFVRETFDGDVIAFCEDTNEAVVIDAEADVVKQRMAFDEQIGDPFGIGQSVGSGSFPVAVRRPPSFEHYVVTASGIAEIAPGDQDRYEIKRTIRIPEADTRSISAVSLSNYGFALVLGRPDPDNPFSADGTVTVHDAETGDLIATYPAGVYPAHVAIDDRLPVASEGVPEAAGLGLTLAGANPVRAHTALDLALDRPASVRVDLLDGLGREVRTVMDGERIAGVHRLRLDVGGLAPGTYVARAVAEGRVVSLPITVVR